MKKLNNVYERSIIKTICYSDIFNYPLKFSEIYKYYIGPKTSEEKIYSNILSLLAKGILEKRGDFIFLNGRKKISALRKRHLNQSDRKWPEVERISTLLSKIPMVRLVGVSGSLSMNNAGKNDDIDLFFITSPKSLWMTRLIVNVFLLLAGIKRGREDLISANKVCPNMFISEDSLEIDQNLFSAHEVAQLRVVVNKNYIHERFLEANKWVKKYMPNAFEVIGERVKVRSNGRIEKILGFIDKIFYLVQYQYMRRRLTTEKVSPQYARFHPQDKTQFVQILHKQRYQFYMKNFGEKQDFHPQKSEFLHVTDTPGY